MHDTSKEGYGFVAKVGRRITFLRNRIGLSQEELAERANLSQQMLARTEGARHPRVSLLTFVKISSGLNVSPAELFKVDNPSPAEPASTSNISPALSTVNQTLRQLQPSDRRRLEKTFLTVALGFVWAKRSPRRTGKPSNRKRGMP